MNPDALNSLLYSSHPLNDGDIRLINLRQSSWDDPIRVELIVTSLSSGSQRYFEALSYVWGDVNSTATVICDGKSIRVTGSLAQALRRLRFRDRDR